MIIKSVHVRNFRCILDETLNCEPLTAIVGPNGTGKSCFLRALELFYTSAPRFSQDDFYNKETSQDIEISITFKDLEDDAKKKFAPYLDREELTVTRVLSLHNEKLAAKLHGAKLQNADFIPIRDAGSAMEVRKQYAEIRQNPEYANLPTVNSQNAAFEAMRQWELDHHEKCTRQRDDGQFFGFTGVGQGYLGRFTRLIPIPAVRDAAEDAQEGRGRPITEILDLVIRATLANRDELKEIREQAQKRYNEVMAGDTAKGLEELEDKLTSTLKTFVPDAAVELQWITEGGIEIVMPNADVKLREHGYSAPVSATGHGLQRAFILTMLQHLAAVQAQAPEDEDIEIQTSAESEVTLRGVPGAMPSLVLAIEEPELYQHPSRQRYLSNILLKLASGTVPGVAKRTQVIYSTHSPLFVGIDRFDQVRVLRKISNGADKPRITKTIEVRGDAVAKELWEACEGKDRNGNSVPMYNWETLQPRLKAIMTPWVAEGFFADVVVLVEGEDERAAILGAAFANNCDFESHDITVIPVGGKSSLDRPCLIFQKFGIRIYVVWDSDKGTEGANPRENHILLRIVGEQISDWPCGVYDRFACFEAKLENTLRDEIGHEVFNSLLGELQVEFGYGNKDDATKSPQLLGELLRRALNQGATSPTLQAIIGSIMKLKE
ncbi:MAG: DUF2813 domain-containing protein [Chloroflexi bacterium]|nr:DUF2813 domain-containing protein [Chloroflexota bacterium]